MATNGVFLLCDANHDSATELGANYRKSQLIPALAALRVQMWELRGPTAQDGDFRRLASLPEVVVISCLGHGVASTLMGQNDAVILEIGSYNPEHVRGRIVHLLSCFTAQSLGVDIVAHGGAAAFLGYADRFSILRAYADQLFECDSEIPLALARGETARHAIEAAQQRFDTYKMKYLDDFKPLVAATFEHNRDKLRGPHPALDPAGQYGNPQASIASRGPIPVT
jgi:hypothetical protein